VYIEKGCGAAAEAFQHLPQSLQQQAELHIFGDGDATLIESLRQRSGVAVHNGVTPEFFRDFASQRRCVGLAMLAGTPRYQLVGTNCTKLYEYFALGMPVIATTVGEFPDQISRNEVGLLIDVDLNVQSLVTAMTKLLINRDTVEQMSRNATVLMQRDEMTWEYEWSKVTCTGILRT
jgi:glycosyltransferase involved in cell wall biosynthesis